MRHPRGLGRPLSTFLVVASVFGTTGAHAADPCDEARRLVGDDAKNMSRDDCQEVVDAAEEERWQLWLDMALAHEHSGDELAAVEYYQRFIDAVDARKRPLSPSWTKARADSVAARERLDAELRATLGRVVVRSTPSDAAASFEGKAMETARLVTPFEAYLKPGDHTLELYHPELGKPVQRTFTLEKGQILTLDVDLAAELDPKKATPPPGDEATRKKALPGAAARKKPTNVLESVGWIGVAAGVGLAATGAVLFADGQSQLDAATCSTESWCTPTAAERARRRDAGESTRGTGVITLIAGGALIAGGIVAIVLSDDDGPDDDLTLEAVAPTLLPDGSPGVGAAFSF